MKKYYADKTGIGILFVLSFLLVMAIDTASLVYLSFIPIIMWIVIGVFSSVFLIIIIIWLPLFFKSLSYCVSCEEITSSSGVFFRTKKILRVKSIQYYTCITTPFSKVTGLNFLVLSALGGNIVLMFLSKKDVDSISAILTKAIFSKTEG